MINLFICLFLAIYFVRAVTVLICLVMCSKRLNNRIDEICDERSIKDLEIEISKIDWYLDNERVASDFLHLFRTIDTQKWINPNLISLLYDHYKV